MSKNAYENWINLTFINDTIITGNHFEVTLCLKSYLPSQFQTKNMGLLKYFLGIKVVQSSSGIAISQQKYALDILTEIGMFDGRPSHTLMDPNVKLLPSQGEPLEDLERYCCLVAKLNYLTVTRLDIIFAVVVLSQFLLFTTPF